jgi:hypothetical protein
MKKVLWVSLLAAIAGLLPGRARAAAAQATGVVIAADAATGRLALDETGDGNADLQLTAGDEASLSIGPAGLSAGQVGLLIGLSARVVYDDSSGDVVSLRVDNYGLAGMIGEITAIDPAALTLSVRNGAIALDLVVAAAAPVNDGEVELALADLERGDRVTVTFVTNASGQAVALTLDADLRLEAAQGDLVEVAAGRVVLRAPSRWLRLRVRGTTRLRVNRRPVTIAEFSDWASRHPARAAVRFIRRRAGALAVTLDARAR